MSSCTSRLLKSTLAAAMAGITFLAGVPPVMAADHGDAPFVSGSVPNADIGDAFLFLDPNEPRTMPTVSSRAPSWRRSGLGTNQANIDLLASLATGPSVLFLSTKKGVYSSYTLAHIQNRFSFVCRGVSAQLSLPIK